MLIARAQRHVLWLLPLLLSPISAGAVGTLGDPAASALTVRATAVVAPCVRAAATAYERTAGGRVQVQDGRLAGSEADLVVGAAVEVTRALESGLAVPGTEVALARIPWVLALPEGNPRLVRRLEDVVAAGLQVRVPPGPASFEARRLLRALPAARLIETSDFRALPPSAVAVLPMSMSVGPGERLPLDVPPLELQAAVAARSRRPEAAGEFLRFLSTERGSQALAGCGLQSGAAEDPR